MPMALKEFVQILVDYISAAHFGLYGWIAEGTERRRGVDALTQQIYSKIASTTDFAVEFNDQSADGISEALTRDLSWLGETLAVRIEHEDRLIERLLAEERRLAGVASHASSSSSTQ